MKKILAVVLTIIMVFSLCACGGDEQKAEKYCYNCGKGITKDVAFCEHCGASQNKTEDVSSDQSSSNESKTEETDKPSSTTQNTSKPTATSNPTVTSKPSTQTHKHSYSKKITAATCTQKGYTKYTCSCGDTYKDNYTNPAHSYSQYICTQCGIHDKEHTYEFLIEYVKHFGEPHASTIQFDIYGDGKVYLNYNAENKDLSICSYSQDSDGFEYCSLSLKTFFYGLKLSSSSGQSADVTGYIDAKNYTAESPLDDIHYNGPSNARYAMIESARMGVRYLTAVLNNFAKQSGDMQLTMADMGFTSYK